MISILRIASLIAFLSYLLLCGHAASIHYNREKSSTAMEKRGFIPTGLIPNTGFIADFAKPILSNINSQIKSKLDSNIDPYMSPKMSQKIKNIFRGQGTYYDVTAGTGSCGYNDTNDELIVAINEEQMENGPNPNTNPKCDRMVTITGQHGTTTARVADTCPTCNRGALDMSPTVFEAVCGQLSIGVCDINWMYI